MEKMNLTERGIAALQPAQPGKRYERFDLQVPGLGVRINHKPKIKVQRGGDGPELAMPQGQYILYAPAERGKAAVRRSLGPITGISLAEARSKALEAKRLLAAGLDPSREARRAKAAATALAEETFGKAMEVYLKRVDKQRRGASTRADIERDILPFFKDRPLREITKADIRQRILEIAEGRNRGKFEGKKVKKRGASPRQARVALSNLRTFFNWAEQQYDDLETVPTESKGLDKLLPATKARKRKLSDDELFAFWRAAERSDRPLKEGYQVLLLTAGRLNEIFEADRRELNKTADLLTIPPERFKSDAEHLIPLSKWAQEIIASIPRWNAGSYIFSRDGEGPARVWTKDRKRLAARMERTLRALARSRGEEWASVKLKPFVLHDLRRTVRTRLSALQVPEEIAELIIGHGRKGLTRVYNLHRAINEMREGLEKWSAHLRTIVMPSSNVPATNVIQYPHPA